MKKLLFVFMCLIISILLVAQNKSTDPLLTKYQWHIKNGGEKISFDEWKDKNTTKEELLLQTHQFIIKDSKLIWEHVFVGTTNLNDGFFDGLIPDNIGKLKWKYMLPAYITTGIFSGDYQIIKNDTSYIVIVKNLKVISETLMTGSQKVTRDVYDIVTKNGELKISSGFPESLKILHQTFLNKFQTITP